MPSIATPTPITNVSTSTNTTAMAPCAATARPRLLSELQHAGNIILAMLSAMTIRQKSKVHAKLEAAGISGEGMTRHHERHAAIDAATTEGADIPLRENQNFSTSNCIPRKSMVAPALISTPAIVLTPEEATLLRLFRSTQDEQRRIAFAMVKSVAAGFPRQAGPALRLVVGGAS